MDRSDVLLVPSTPPRSWSSTNDILRGVRIGARCGVVAIVARFVMQLIPELRMPLGSGHALLLAVVAPLASGVASGALVGALWPWRRHAATAIALGLAAGWIFTGGIAVGWSAARGWTGINALLWLILGAVIGLPLGALMYDLGQATTPETVRVGFVQATRRSHSLAKPTPWTTCPCCGYPTFQRTERLPHCVLCEWEEPAPGEESAVSLADARANFARFGTIYDPQHLPAWMPRPPSAAARRERGEMRAAVEAMGVERRPDRLSELWGRFYRAWDALRATEQHEVGTLPGKTRREPPNDEHG